MMADGDWRDNLVTTEAGVAEVVRGMRRIAVLGIKPESRSERPAYYVPRYLKDAGYEVIPVPVYYPDVDHILGEPVCRDLAAVPGGADMVNVFRRPHDIPAHVDDLIALKPKVVWFQLGIRNDDAAERLARAGIRVIQNRCSMIDHRRFGR